MKATILKLEHRIADVIAKFGVDAILPEITTDRFATCIDAYHFDNEIRAIILVSEKWSLKSMAELFAIGFNSDIAADALREIVDEAASVELLAFAYPEKRRSEAGVDCITFAEIGRGTEVNLIRTPPLYIVQKTGDGQ